MPEKPEVITVAKKLKSKLINQKISAVQVFYNNIVSDISVDDFIKNVEGEKILDIDTRGKFIVFHLNKYKLLFHLRMEGKFYYRELHDENLKHEHARFDFDNGVSLRFLDTRKFGRIYLLENSEFDFTKPISNLGLEVWDKNLTKEYLKDKFKNKNIPIKTTLLDQSIICGIGNIYADEILFLSKVHPLTKSRNITYDKLDQIIKNSIEVLDKAIIEGGTTIRSYTSEEDVSGNNQNNLYVHQRKGFKCRACENIIEKIKVGGRGTYYCPNCQKEE